MQHNSQLFGRIMKTGTLISIVMLSKHSVLVIRRRTLQRICSNHISDWLVARFFMLVTLCPILGRLSAICQNV